MVGPDGKALFTRADIFAGQDVNQRYGLMDHGSVWGHGSQRGAEFSAVTLHAVGEAVRDQQAREGFGKAYGQLSREQADVVDVRTRRTMKANQHDRQTDVLRLSAGQVTGLKLILDRWERTFRDGDGDYGFLPGTVPTVEERLQIGRFFYWTAWVASAERPGTDHSFTNNWPPDRSVGNVATAETYVWSIAGILSLFITLGLFVYWVHKDKLWYGAAQGVPLAQKLLAAPLTSSQLKAAKFFLVVILLFLVQTAFGLRRTAGPLLRAPGGVLPGLGGQDHPVQLGQDLAPAAGHLLDRHHLGGLVHLPGPHRGRDRAQAAGVAGAGAPCSGPAGSGGQSGR